MTNPEDLKQTLSHFLWKNEEPKHNENNKWSLCFSHQPPHFQKPLAGVQSEMIMNSRRSLTLDRHTPTRKCFPHCFLRSACREKQNTEREDDSFSVTWFNYTNCGIAFKFQLSNDVAKPRHVCKYWNEQCSEKWKSKVQQSGLLHRPYTAEAQRVSVTLGEYQWYSVTPSSPMLFPEGSHPL